MAANFWTSTHFSRWLYPKDKISAMRKDLEDRTKFSIENELLLQAHYIRMIQSIGKKLAYKQIVISTAATFFKRFYLLTSVLDNDPRVVAPTCLYLAAKIEEMGQVRPDPILSKLDQRDGKVRPAELYSCEMIVLAKLNFDLVVFHPYQEIKRYVVDCGQEASLFPTAWAVLNDSLRSDVVLTYPPSIIALSAVYIGSIHLDIDVTPWFDELNINLEQVRECVNDLVVASEMEEQQVSKISTVVQDLKKYHGRKYTGSE